MGWGRPGVVGAFGPSGQASLAILPALGGDAVGAVLGAGATPLGHHGAAIRAVVLRRVGFGGRYPADRAAQAGKQQRAARGGDIGAPRRGGQNQRGVGQLLITPPQKVFTK